MNTRKKQELLSLLRQYKRSNGRRFNQSIIKLSDGKYNIKNIKFNKFTQLISRSKYGGIVLLGAGGDLQKWVKGITTMLNQEQISIGDVQELFSGLYILTTTGGRNDLAMVFNKEGKHNLGKLAMWRLRFGDCSWVSDYIDNYEDQHEL